MYNLIMEMQKTTLRIPKDILKAAKAMAVKEDVSVQDIVSTSIKQYLQKNTPIARKKKKVDILIDMTKSAKQGPPNLSIDDHILYKS